MKTNMKYVLSIASMGFALSCMAAGPGAGAPPIIVDSGLPRATTSTGQIAVPESYVWDGSEYVGTVGDQYYYLGSDNVWQPMDSGRLDRFQAWEKDNPNWRDHATHNDSYYRVMGQPAQPQPIRYYAPGTRPTGPQPQYSTPSTQPTEMPQNNAPGTHPTEVPENYTPGSRPDQSDQPPQ